LDLVGVPTTFTNALGQMSMVARDVMQRVTSSVDAISRTNQVAYEARGLLATATAPLIGTAAYQRNGLGELTAITDLNGRTWSFAYTLMGRVLSVADPLNRTNRFAYDARGRLNQTTFADGVTRSNSFDAASNLTRRKYSSGPDLQYTFDNLNRLTTADELALAYDAEDRVTNTASSGVNQTATYDADGSLTSVSYNNGAVTIAYTYDSRDRLVQVKDSLTSAQVNFAYDDAGRLINTARANGVNGIYTYDAANRLTRIQEGSIIDLQFTVNAVGEVTNANLTAPLDPASFTSASLNGFNYDPAHEISSGGFAYDARGRQTASPGHSMTWDGASRLTGIDAVTLAYNGLNDLVTRTTGGTTTRFFYNLALGLHPIVAEKNDTTSILQRYYVWTPGGRLLYLIDAAHGNAVYYFHADRVGSTLALTSGAGATTDAYAYSPYGVILGRTGANPQPFTYIGSFGVRAEGALYQMRARYYDPASARFLTKDSVAPSLADVRTLDPYNYALENPVAYVDPNGTCPGCLAVVPGPDGSPVSDAGPNIASPGINAKTVRFQADQFAESAQTVASTGGMAGDLSPNPRRSGSGSVGNAVAAAVNSPIAVLASAKPNIAAMSSEAPGRESVRPACPCCEFQYGYSVTGKVWKDYRHLYDIFDKADWLSAPSESDAEKWVVARLDINYHQDIARLWQMGKDFQCPPGCRKTTEFKTVPPSSVVDNGRDVFGKYEVDLSVSCE
jgi:RHS repeat-associated protein